MIIEVLLGGAAWIGAECLKGGNTDKQRLDRIFRKCGLYVKYNQKEDTPKLLRTKKAKDHTEYVYRLPEGLTFTDFKKKKEAIETSLNGSKEGFKLANIKNVDVNKGLKQNIKRITNGETYKKEVLLSYDTTLKIKVYNQPLTKYLSYENNCKGWTVPVGVSREKDNIKHDFEKVMHMVVAGTTRYGKSVFLKTAITTLVLNQPDNALFTMIDLKGGLTFDRFKECPQMQAIAEDAEQALEKLEAINTQMNEVMAHLKDNRHENVQEAGIKARHFVIIDEGAELAPGIEKDKELRQIKNQCEVILSRIARIGGVLGYRLIYATQTPYSEVLNHNIKQNCDAKLCFKLQTDKASEVVLGEGITDAAHLPFIKGRGVYLTDRKYIVQTPMIDNDYIEGVVEHASKDSRDH